MGLKIAERLEAYGEDSTVDQEVVEEGALMGCQVEVEEQQDQEDVLHHCQLHQFDSLQQYFVTWLD